MLDAYSYKEFEDRVLAVKARQVTQELEKLNTEQLEKFSLDAKEKMISLKQGDKDFSSGKDISNQRYIIEILNSKQIELGQFNLSKTSTVISNGDLTEDALSDAKFEQQNQINSLNDLIDQQKSNRLESGYGGRITQMSKVIDQINSRESVIDTTDSISDLDFNQIISEESAKVDLLKSSTYANADEIKSHMDSIEKLNHISKQREMLSDSNNPYVTSNFEAHDDDVKIDALKAKLSEMNQGEVGKNTLKYHDVAKQLNDLRRDYSGNDPSTKLYSAVIRDRELSGKKSDLEKRNFHTLSGAEQFGNDVEISKLSIDISRNLRTINGISDPSFKKSMRINAFNYSQGATSEKQDFEIVNATEVNKIKENEITYITEIQNNLSPDVGQISNNRLQDETKNSSDKTIEFEHHEDDTKIKQLKKAFESVPGGKHNSTEYTKADKELFDARISYAGNDPEIKLHSALLKEQRFEYKQKIIEAKIFSDRTTGMSELRNLNNQLNDLKTDRASNLLNLDKLYEQKDAKELDQRKPTFAEKLKMDREIARARNEQSNQGAVLKALPYMSEAGKEKAQQLSAAVDANTQKRAAAQAEAHKPAVDDPTLTR